MLLGFKRRFAPMVKDGSKTHTMRGKRKRRPRIGETCHCYVDPRQKTMALLGRWLCLKVEDVLIYQCDDGTLSMFVEGVELSMAEKNSFAWSDGFRSWGKKKAWEELSEFWISQYSKIIQNGGTYRLHFPEFEGDIIHWRYQR